MKDIAVLDLMVERKIVPPTGTFEVKMFMVDKFYEIYGELYSKKFTRVTGTNITYAKKLAGLSLMKLNIARSTEENVVTLKLKVTKPKCGILYLISNPAFPNIFKVGITRDLDNRLKQYQTGDPHRKYKVEHYKFVEDIRMEEKRILEHYKLNIVNGEWISSEKALMLFTISE